MPSVTLSIESVLAVLDVVGLPALFVVFVLKGALVGKIFPTSVCLSGYVVLTGPTRAGAVSLVVLVTVAHVIGQFAVYTGSRRYGEELVAAVPYLHLEPSSDRFRRVDRWFDRYGDLAVFGTNVIPWSRGLIAIPAGVSAYPRRRYFVHVGSSTLLYHGVYVAVPLFGLAALG
ncbi:membrane-associated protein [Natronorubrum sp. JWXQ-INN-674]|uniref:Membrane-associated protein n=2 Tax=Natronorubrum halalkaliphilum TaxID=2691917 RepID=A0A6B0VIE1_9EURY|nr:membrane-associated protein [Natronorubrum halalkaliphilum]